MTGSLTCAIRQDNAEVECWGFDGARPPEGLQLKTMILASYAGCGIGLDDEVHCWSGADALQQALPPGMRFSQLGIGFGTFGYHICGLRADDGRVFCWGDDSWGQVSGAPNAVEAHGFNCALREGDQLLTCWGALIWNPL